MTVCIHMHIYNYVIYHLSQNRHTQIILTTDSKLQTTDILQHENILFLQPYFQQLSSRVSRTPRTSVQVAPVTPSSGTWWWAELRSFQPPPPVACRVPTTTASSDILRSEITHEWLREVWDYTMIVCVNWFIFCQSDIFLACWLRCLLKQVMICVFIIIILSVPFSLELVFFFTIVSQKSYIKYLLYKSRDSVRLTMIRRALQWLYHESAATHSPIADCPLNQLDLKKK